MRSDSFQQRRLADDTNSRGRLLSLALAAAIPVWCVPALGAQETPTGSATTPSLAASPPQASFAHANQLSVLGGLNQIALRGGNVEATWYTNRFSFEYSHGFNLHMTGWVLGKSERDQHLQLRVPWTTGFGLGYRVTSDLDLRVESKLHRYQVFYENQHLGGTSITTYTTETEGVGAYYRVYPFARFGGWARGIVVAPSVRYWPNVWSSLPKGGYTYANALTGRNETLKAATQGIPGTTGLFVNASVGYTF
jgi:hypothetical protein